VELATAERVGQFRDLVRHLARSQDGAKATSEPDYAFGDLMDRMGIDAATYQPFQTKIRRDHRLPGNDATA